MGTELNGSCCCAWSRVEGRKGKEREGKGRRERKGGGET